MNCDAEQEKFWSIEVLDIPNPCPVPWDSMKGNQRVRFCNQCSKNVYNISDMSPAQAEKLLIDSEGRVCISMLKRADGTIVSDSCPLILRPVRNSYRKAAAIFSAIIALVSTQLSARADDDSPDTAKGTAGSAKDQQNNAPKPPTVVNSAECKKEPMRLGGAPPPPVFQKPPINSKSNTGSSSQLSSKTATPAKSGVPPIAVSASKPHLKLNYVADGVSYATLAKYLAHLQDRITVHWHPYNYGNSRTTVVSFDLNKMGGVSNLKVLSSSGAAQADATVTNAINTASGMFRRLPPAYPLETLKIKIEFVQ